MLISDTTISSIVIAGAGGFSLEVFDYLTSANSPKIAGFIDDTAGIQAPAGTHCPLLGTIQDFRPEPGQAVIVAIGSAQGRAQVLTTLWEKNIHTPALIAPGAMVSPGAQIERGVIVCPLSIINRNAKLNEGSLVNVHCSVGHGATIGAFSVLSPYAALNGDAQIGKRCFLGTRATIYPQIHLGDDCVVDSHTGVRMSAESKKMISCRGTYQVSHLRL